MTDKHAEHAEHLSRRVQACLTLTRVIHDDLLRNLLYDVLGFLGKEPSSPQPERSQCKCGRGGNACDEINQDLNDPDGCGRCGHKKICHS